MESGKVEQTGVNKGGPGSDSGTELTQRRSGPVRYRLLNKDGIPFGPYPTRQAAADMARELWPGEPQADDDHDGWDIETT